MKTPRKIDQPITQTSDPRLLLGRLLTTLNVAHTEARLAFQRQLEHFEILEHRVRQVIDALPKPVIVLNPKALPPAPKRRKKLNPR